jgi:hypothetical protein
MKLSYSREEVERWRDKTYRRTARSGITSERQALSFINSVGFCLAAKADGIELPSLWEAVMVGNAQRPHPTRGRSYYLSYAWEIQSILPNHNSVYYGKIFRRRPSLVSREFFPYFYALTERTGDRDEHHIEHTHGNLSLLAKQIMDTLFTTFPMTTKELKAAVEGKGTRGSEGFEKALDELQRGMFISRVVGSEHQFGAEWAPVIKIFPAEVRRAKKISAEQARYTLLEKYFKNQLVSSVEAIHKVFGWSRQAIYHAIGQLVHAGIITTTVAPDGNKENLYCLVR